MSKQQSEEQEGSQEENVEHEDSNWNEISKLQDVGVNAGDIKKLKEAGCHTVESLVMRTKKSLCAIKGLSEAKVDKILEAAAKISVRIIEHVLFYLCLVYWFHYWCGNACQETRGSQDHNR